MLCLGGGIGGGVGVLQNTRKVGDGGMSTGGLSTASLIAKQDLSLIEVGYLASYVVTSA